MRRSVVWVKPEGAELARVELDGDGLRAEGEAIGAVPVPYRLAYELTTTAGLATSRLVVRADGDGWHRSLELLHDPGDGWTAHARADGHLAMPPPGGETAPFAKAVDCDLALSPLTNTMPVLRDGLLSGGRADLVMVWVAVPDLSLHASRQTYAFVRRDGEHSVIRFMGGDVTQEIRFDADGLVEDYPGIGHRVPRP